MNTPAPTPAQPPRPASPVLPAVGERLGQHYRLLRCLNLGGMGAVFEALDERTDRRRALKVVLPQLQRDPRSLERFWLEARATANLPSEHLLDVLDAGLDPATGCPFLVTELLEGEDLGQRIARSGPLPMNEALPLLDQIAEALDQTHAVGLVHRDLKPENLFLVERGVGLPRLKLLDFGVAKLVAECTDDARTTRAVGTPLYMAPEQIRGDGAIDGRADLWALAQLAYVLLVGKPYFHDEHVRSGTAYGVMLAVVGGTVEPASVRAARQGVLLPPGFDPWFHKATSPEAHGRFSLASTMIDALRAALDTPTTNPPVNLSLSSTAPRLSLAPLASRRRGWLGAMAAAASLLALGATAWSPARTAPPPLPTSSPGPALAPPLAAAPRPSASSSAFASSQAAAPPQASVPSLASAAATASAVGQPPARRPPAHVRRAAATADPAEIR